MPETQRAPESDFHFVERDDPEQIAAMLEQLVQDWVEAFVIQGGVCVARTGRKHVKVRG
jgi:hypothetical protein